MVYPAAVNFTVTFGENSSKKHRTLVLNDFQWYIIIGKSEGRHGTVVARWTAGQQVERSILHLGYDYSHRNKSLAPGCSRPSISLQCRCGVHNIHLLENHTHRETTCTFGLKL